MGVVPPAARLNRYVDRGPAVFGVVRVLLTGRGSPGTLAPVSITADPSRAALGGLELLPAPRPAWALVWPESGGVLPAECACCDGDASCSAVVQGAAEQLLVPYCERCYGAQAAVVTRRLAAVLAALVGASAAALTWPVLAPRASVWGFGLAVLTASLAPIIALSVVHRRPGQGRSSEGAAVFFSGPERLVCTHPAWAARAAALNRVELEEVRRHEAVVRASTLGVPLAAMVLAPILYGYLFPELMILNLGNQPVTLSADGGPLGTLQPTSLESPGAGLHVRVAAGHRHFHLSFADGTQRDMKLLLRRGRTHLLAPNHDRHCFWLESAAYGRASADSGSHPLRTLPAGEFWVLPRPVDRWFQANPPASEDGRSTGGSLTALRHRRCSEAMPGSPH